jgi:hypothetical protein
MTNDTIYIHNVENDEIIVREMNADEIAQREIDLNNAAIKAQAQIDKANAKTQLLEKLGISEDEAKLLQ